MGDPDRGRPALEAHERRPAAVLVEPAHALTVHGMQDFVPGRHDPELVPGTKAPIVAGVEIEKVVLGEVGLFGAVFGPHDLGDEALVVGADVAEADNFAFEAEGLGGAFGRADGGDRFHARDLWRSRGEPSS